MKRHLTLAAAAVLALAAVAPAAVAAPDKPSTPPAKQNACFWPRFADSFAAPDEHNLYIRVSARDVYHFEMFGPCLGIDWDQRLALVSRNGIGQICTGMDAEIVAHDPALGRQRCTVRSINKLTPEEVAALPKRAKP